VDPERARELLARERARVERALADLDAGRKLDDAELAHYDQHQADDGTELFDRELSDSLEPRLRARLEAIERAERRLEEGTYGRSVRSGEPIPDERLELMPWAERTAEEEARLEGRRVTPRGPAA
jgi:DnaK suppressor protein